MEWWTARRINEWERARRGMRWLQYQQQDGVITIRLQSDQPLQEATLLLTAEHGEVSAEATTPLRVERTERWGVAMTAVTLDLHGEVTLRLRVS